jgi:hypothetical protein
MTAAGPAFLRTVTVIRYQVLSVSHLLRTVSSEGGLHTKWDLRRKAHMRVLKSVERDRLLWEAECLRSFPKIPASWCTILFP